MFEKRLRGYRAIGYARGEAPLGYAEPGDEVVVEYDEKKPSQKLQDAKTARLYCVGERASACEKNGNAILKRRHEPHGTA
jgi:hypothetical protein